MNRNPKTQEKVYKLKDGRKLTVKQMANIAGVHFTTVRARIRRGLDEEEWMKPKGAIIPPQNLPKPVKKAIPKPRGWGGL